MNLKIIKKEKYLFKFHGIKNELLYQLILENIIDKFLDFHLKCNITIAFIDFQDDKFIRLSNDCKFTLSRTNKISVDELYSKF